MNRPILLSAASLLILLLGGCSTSPSPAPDDPQKGAIVFNSSVSPEVAVAAGSDTKAAATRTLPASCLPGPEQMKLKLTASSGPTFEMNYESMVDYDQPLLDPGSYTAKFMYGDPATEGPDEAYFEGTVTCTIVARKTVTQEVTHTLANSVYTLHLSDWFKNYYTSYSLTVYTESGYQSGHTQVPDLNPTPIFVRANTKLYLSGKATKTNGVEVEFPKTLIGTTEARTWHSIEIDAGSAGQASLDLRFDDTPTTVETREIELNPEA